MANVTLDRLTKRYANAADVAVSDVSLGIADGEFMVLLGPSGCGKSTTLRMIAGLEPISEGTLAIDGVRMNDVPAKDRDIAMVFQSYALYPHMTVYDNLAFGLKRRGLAKEDIDRRVRTATQMLGLTPYLARKPFALSGGQRQRVALGRAIVREPRVFLFDEPLSNLDASLRVSTRNELIKLHQRLKATMIYVTHDQIEAMTMGTRICIMNKGRVAQIGPPLEVYRAPADTFVASFLGNPPMNLLPARIEVAEGRPLVVLGAHRLTLPGSDVDALLAHAGRDVVFGIRPEDVRERRASAPGPELAGIVTAVEPLGAETLVTLALDAVGRELVLRGGRDCRSRVGDRFIATLDLTATHVFAADSTHIVARGGAEPPKYETSFPVEQARA